MSAGVSERVVQWDGGVAYVNDAIDKIWDANFLEVRDHTLSAEVIAAHAEKIMGATRAAHRRVRVSNPEVGAELEPAFMRLGWAADVHVVMSHRHEPNRVVDTSDVQELGDATWLSRAEQLGTYPDMTDDDTIRQMRAFYELAMAAGSGRDFGIVEDDKVVSFALLYSDGAIGQIEDVATLEPYRNRGYSWRVVSKVLAESRALHDITFLVADDRDWPKDFYSKMGFEVVGRHYFFLRRPLHEKGPA